MNAEQQAHEEWVRALNAKMDTLDKQCVDLEGKIKEAVQPMDRY